MEVCRLSGYLGLAWISGELGVGWQRDFERGSPWSLPSHVHTCLLGIPLHFQALRCLWPWSLESPRRCIPLLALNDHITLNPLGSKIPFQRWKTILLLLEKSCVDRVNLSAHKGSLFPLSILLIRREWFAQLWNLRLSFTLDWQREAVLLKSSIL